MQYIHEMVGPAGQRAEIVETYGRFRIDDGWNVGEKTRQIIFPNMSTARIYLGAIWNCGSHSINWVASREVAK